MSAKRSELRAQVIELSGGQCEHPAELGRCPYAGTEMAHIRPRGMGHTGYRDTLDNVMWACDLHARSTDDLASREWQWVEKWVGLELGWRQGLAAYVAMRRAMEGFDTDETQDPGR